MLRSHAVLLLLVLSGCAPTARVPAAPEPDAWRRDWRAFGEAVAPYARAGVLERHGDVIAFNRLFGGEVEWAGTVRSVHDNGVGIFVVVEMAPISLTLRDGTVLSVDGLELQCAVRDPGCAWSEETVGKEVVFRTSLENRTRGILPVVRVERIDSKERWIVVETDGADLVRVGR